MAKVKIEREFGMIPNELLYNAEMSLSSKGLYGFIYAKPDDWDFSVERISAELKEGEKSVNNAIKELEKFGWLSREKFKNAKGRWEVEYTLHSKPQKIKNHTPSTTPPERQVENDEKEENHTPSTRGGQGRNNKKYIKNYNNSNKLELLETSENSSLKNSPNFVQNFSEVEIVEESKNSPTPPKAPRSPVSKNHSLEYLDEQAQKIENGEILDFPDFVSIENQKAFTRFLLYWTEPDKNGKIRAKKEKTFEIKRRFLVWLSRENNFSGKNFSSSPQKSRIG